MPSQRDKWNRHYQNSAEPDQPVWVLTEFKHLLPGSGKALDLACGTGGNSLFMANKGLTVTAWDISDVVIGKLAAIAEQAAMKIDAETRNVEKNPPDADSFDVIVVSRFLYRPLCPFISNALRSGGLLFYQTFSKAGRELVQKGPTNPDYLLTENELPLLFPELSVKVSLDPSQASNLINETANDMPDLEPLAGQACLVAQKS